MPIIGRAADINCLERLCESPRAGFATNSLGFDNVCSSATVNFFKSVPCCRLDVTTEPLHAGRSTAVIRVTIRQAETGRVIAQSTHNMFLFSRR